MSNNRVRSQPKSKIQSDRPNQGQNQSQNHQQSRQQKNNTNRNKQYCRNTNNLFVLSNDQSITVLNYLQRHFDLRITEIKNFKSKIFGACLLTDYELQHRCMPSTTLEIQTDMKNKEQQIQKLLLDRQIQIPYHIIEYIILFSTKE